MGLDRESTCERVADYVEEAADKIGASAAATIIARGGKTVLERYWGTDHHMAGAKPVGAQSRFHVYSVRKTYIGLAAAIALHDGDLRGLDDEIGAYLEDLPAEVVEGTTIRHLVTRCHGLEQVAGTVRRAFPPGGEWQGSNLAVELLCAIVQRTTGWTIRELLYERVFRPAQLTETDWESGPSESLVYDVAEVDSPPARRFGRPDGTERNLYVSARDLTRWGQLHLRHGELAGRRVLPREVFEWVTSVQSPPSLPRDRPHHGFFWWINDNKAPQSELGDRLPASSFQVLGASGCACLVIPERQAVAVRMYNRLGGPKEYDYLTDIRAFGNLVMDSLEG